MSLRKMMMKKMMMMMMMTMRNIKKRTKVIIQFRIEKTLNFIFVL